MYTKNDAFTWNSVFEAYDQKYLDRFYRFEDEKGKFTVGDLTGAGVRKGASGKPWKGFNPSEGGRHWAMPNAAIKRAGINGDFEKMSPQEKLDFLEDKGFIYWPPKGKVPRFKRYIENDRGVAAQDIITDIGPLSSQAQERLGYPTQKPLALLERIIAASSNEGDVVLDPFCGCGTAVHAAEKLGRKWIGIDVTHLAVTLIEKRMKDAYPAIEFDVKGRPQTLAAALDLAQRDKYQFQWWAVSLVDALPFGGKKKGADGGIDGIIYFKPDGKKTEKAIVSVKGGKNVSVTMIRDLHSAMEREKAPIGIFITAALPTRPMEKEAAAVGRFEDGYGKSHPRLQILTIAELFQNKKPSIPNIDLGSLKSAKREDISKQGKLI